MTKPEKTTKTGRKPPKRPVADKEQYERFREFAREVDADEDPEAFDQKFRKIVRRKTSSPNGA